MPVTMELSVLAMKEVDAIMKLFRDFDELIFRVLTFAESPDSFPKDEFYTN